MSQVNTITIAHCNVRGTLNENENKIINIIKKCDIDIFCIQEVTTLRKWSKKQKQEWITNQEKLLENNNLEYEIACNNCRTAIFYKNNIKNNISQNDIDFKQNETQYITSIVLHKGSKHTTIVSYYRQPNNQTNYDRLKSIIKKLQQNVKNKQSSLIISGDFNAHSNVWGDDNDCEHGENVLTLSEECNFGILNNGETTYYNKANKTWKAIDLTLFTSDIIDNVSDWNVLGKKWPVWESDHYLCIFKLHNKIKQNKVQWKQSWNIPKRDDIKWQQYNDELHKQIINFDRYYQFITNNKNNKNKFWLRQAINKLNFYLTHAIYNAAKFSIGFKWKRESNNNWYNKIIDKLKKQCKKLKRRIAKCKNSKTIKVITNKLNKLQKEKNEKIKNEKTKFENSLNQIINESIDDSKTFYNVYNKTRNKKSRIPSLKNNDGIIIAWDDLTKAQILHNKFTTPPQIQNNNEYSDWYIEIENEVKKYDKTENENENTELKKLNGKINLQLLLNTLKEINYNKAIGPDLIHNSFIINGINILKYRLIKIFNLSYENAIVPDAWKLSNITPIPKPGRNNSIVKNNRPISLTSCICRLFEKVLVKKLLKYCIKNKSFNRWQNAFQQNKGIDDIVLDLVSDANWALQQKAETDVVLLDLSSAYDVVWHGGLKYKIQNHFGIKGNFYRWISDYLSNRYSRVILESAKTKWKKLEVGIPQGGPLAPLLFIIYTNDFATKKLIEENIDEEIADDPFQMNQLKYNDQNGINLGIFADDTTMWTDSITNKNYDHIQTQLQNELTKFEQYCKKWKLVLNESKCKVLKISNKNEKNKKYRKYTLHGKALEYVRNARLLGVILDEKLNWHAQIDKLQSRLNQKMYQLAQIANTKKFSLKPIAIWKLFNSHILPIIEYGIQYFCHANKTKVEKILNTIYRAARLALKAKLSTPKRHLMKLLNFENPQFRIEKIQLKIFEKLSHSPNDLNGYYIFHKWKERYNNYTNNKSKNKNKIFEKNPISQMYNVKQNLFQNEKILTYITEREYIKAMPTYDENYPLNLKIDFKQIIDPNIVNDLPNTIVGYTDGSVYGNPGYGGYGWYIPQQHTINETDFSQSMKTQTTINICELSAIESMLDDLSWKIKRKKVNGTIKWIIIRTDSKFTQYILDLTGYPKQQCHWKIINNIFHICNELRNLNVKIKIQKVKSHINIDGNEKADHAAKLGAYDAFPNNEDRIMNEEFGTVFDSLSYSIALSKDIKQLKNKWKKINENEEYIKHGPINSKIMYNIPNSKHLLNELKYLNNYESAMITWMRTEHAPLNYYRWQFPSKHIGDNHCGMCLHCSTNETVYHFMIDCNKYDKQRMEMMNNLCKLDKFYSNIIFRYDLQNILFPHLHQCNSNDKTKNNANLKIRINILKCVCKYILDTKRFEEFEFVETKQYEMMLAEVDGS